MTIKCINVVNLQGSKLYEVGMMVAGEQVTRIEVSPIYFTGDPFCHYCGFGEKGKLLFSLNPQLPLDVEYL